MTQLASNEAEVEIEVDTTPADTEAEVEIEVTDEPEPEGYDPKKKVEFSTPEQQKKFNDIYKQAKMSDKRNQMYWDMLQKQQSELDELRGRFQQTDHAEAERILESRLHEARENGDEAKADKIMKEIIDFRVESRLKKEAPKENKKPPVNDPDVQAVVAFAEERDSRGSLLRPWIAESHPQHQNAMKIASAMALEVNSEFGFVDIPEVMRRMDDAMKPKRPVSNSRAPDPMRGNLTNSPNRGKIKLSSAELEVAQKLGVKPEDYAKWKR